MLRQIMEQELNRNGLMEATEREFNLYFFEVYMNLPEEEKKKVTEMVANFKKSYHLPFGMMIIPVPNSDRVAKFK